MSIIPKWSKNAGYMLAYQVEFGAKFVLTCSACQVTRRLNLPKIVLQENPLWSPWGRRPTCPTCGRQMLIMGSHGDGHGAMMYPLTAEPGDNEWPEVASMQAAWRGEQRRIFGPSWRTPSEAKAAMDAAEVAAAAGQAQEAGEADQLRLERAEIETRQQQAVKAVLDARLNQLPTVWADGFPPGPRRRSG